MAVGTESSGNLLAFPQGKAGAAESGLGVEPDANPLAADLLAADLLARVIGILRGYDPDGADIYLPLSHVGQHIADRVVLGLGDATRCLTSSVDERVIWTSGASWPVWCEWSIGDAVPRCMRLVIAGCPDGALASAEDERSVDDDSLDRAEQWLTEALERQLLVTAAAS